MTQDTDGRLPSDNRQILPITKRRPDPRPHRYRAYRPMTHQGRGRNRYLSTCVIRTEHQSNDNRGHRASTARSTARAPHSTAQHRARSGAPPRAPPPGAPRATPSVANCLKRLRHPNGRPRTFSQRVKPHDVHSILHPSDFTGTPTKQLSSGLAKRGFETPSHAPETSPCHHRRSRKGRPAL